MGLFNKIFGKKNSGNALESNPKFVNMLTQEVAVYIYDLQITRQPLLRFFKADHGLRESVIRSHLSDPEVKAIKGKYGEQAYLSLLGCHALGAGGYITICQNKLGKSVDKFTDSDIAQIQNAFQETDIYELFLNTMGFALDGNNKHCMDAIVMTCVNSAAVKLGKQNACKDENVADLMRVLFNAGITVVMR